MGDQIGQLDGLARIGQHQQRIVAGDHAEIAMARFGRMDEMGRRSGRGERGRDLARDMTGFAHAADDDAPADQKDGVDRLGEFSVEAGAQGVERVAGMEEDPACGGKVARTGRLDRFHLGRRHDIPLILLGRGGNPCAAPRR